jgi:hypothetical protein
MQDIKYVDGVFNCLRLEGQINQINKIIYVCLNGSVGMEAVDKKWDICKDSNSISINKYIKLLLQKNISK